MLNTLFKSRLQKITQSASMLHSATFKVSSVFSTGYNGSSKPLKCLNSTAAECQFFLPKSRSKNVLLVNNVPPCQNSPQLGCIYTLKLIPTTKNIQKDMFIKTSTAFSEELRSMKNSFLTVLSTCSQLENRWKAWNWPSIIMRMAVCIIILLWCPLTITKCAC